MARWIKASEFTAYKVPLEDLINRARARYEKATHREFPKCPYCDSLMMFRHSTVVVDIGPVRDDMGFKCPRCFHTAHFGIPITRAEALEEIDLRGGPTLTRPSIRPDEDGLDIVKVRLRRLGYIE